jgi:hypothetical protein
MFCVITTKISNNVSVRSGKIQSDIVKSDKFQSDSAKLDKVSKYSRTRYLHIVGQSTYKQSDRVHVLHILYSKKIYSIEQFYIQSDKVHMYIQSDKLPTYSRTKHLHTVGQSN